MVRRELNGKLKQGYLVITIEIDISDIRGKVWKKSFMKVDLHPHNCVSFPV